MRIRSFMSTAWLALGLVIAVQSPSHAQDGAELSLRIDRLESQLRTLTGLIEELTFQVEDLERLVVVLRADNEALYRLLAEANGEVDVAPAVIAEPQVVGAPAVALGEVPAAPLPQAAGGPLDLTQALRPDGALNIDGVGNVAEPIITPEVAALDPGAAAQPLITGDAAADYDLGYRYVLNGDYVLAEQSFRSFLSAYPGHQLTVDARFWLAESMLSRQMYSEAAAEFYDAYVANPQHQKAPEMLLKLGISLVQLGQVESACGTFEQVLQRYPGASSALLQRVAVEQANAGC